MDDALGAFARNKLDVSEARLLQKLLYLAAIGDVARPSWRAQSVGVYRLWRDLGYAIGALLSGLVADALGISAAMWTVAALTCISGLVVAVRMAETMQTRRVGPLELVGLLKRGAG